MSLALYDLDLWHRAAKTPPSFELMKVYRYLNSNNYTVKMLTPTDEFSSFNSIIFFKQYKDTPIPKKVNVTDKKYSLYGYGFYGKNTPLKKEITLCRPSYIPYERFDYKLKTPFSFHLLEKHSLVRVSTNDYADLKEKDNCIMIADEYPLQVSNMKEFLDKYKKYSDFTFFHTLKVDSKENLEKFYQYRNLFRKKYIMNFRFDENTFFQYMNDSNVVFQFKQEDWESKNNLFLRLTKMILAYKHNNVKYRNPYPFTDKFLSYIDNWGKSVSCVSYEEFYKNNKEALRFMAAATTELRLLLKQNPLTINNEYLDLQKNL